MKKDYRYIYIVYLAIAIILGFALDKKYDFTNTSQNTASYIATISELLGLSVALTEIFILKKISEEIKNSFSSFQSFSDISTMSIFLSQTKDDLLSGKYSTAVLRLESIKNVYQENLTNDQISDMNSDHRKNLDKLNSIITSLNLSDYSINKIKQNKLRENISFLTTFNETLISLKITYKNQRL